MRKRNQQPKGGHEEEDSNCRTLRVSIEAWGVGIIGLLAMSGPPLRLCYIFWLVTHTPQGITIAGGDVYKAVVVMMPDSVLTPVPDFKFHFIHLLASGCSEE